jgi:hypothetical protein
MDHQTLNGVPSGALPHQIPNSSDTGHGFPDTSLA